MTTVPLWPSVLENKNLDDSRLAAAYEASPAALRACIKTGIALTYALHGERPALCEQRVEDPVRAFCYGLGRRPADWTLLFVSPDYAAGPRLCAALLPPLLAGVPLVGAVCVGGEPSLSARLVFELAGLEEIFCLADVEEAQALLQQMCAERPPARGRVLLLHKGELAPLGHSTRACSLPLWEESAAPRIAFAPGQESAVSTLRWAHPDVKMEEFSPAVDALFCAPMAAAPPPDGPPLLLGEGLEGFWWHHDLDVAFFQQTYLRASSGADRTRGESSA